jgi:hypothetical protein
LHALRAKHRSERKPARDDEKAANSPNTHSSQRAKGRVTAIRYEQTDAVRLVKRKVRLPPTLGPRCRQGPRLDPH